MIVKTSKSYIFELKLPMNSVLFDFKTKIDQAVTERDFLSHELDRTKEDLKRMAKSHKLMSKMQSQQPSQGPDPKRPRVTSPQRHTLTSRGAAPNIPKSIDR